MSLHPRFRRTILASTIAALLASGTSQSASLVWDAGNTTNGATIDPADGVWNLTNTFWNNATADVAWTQTNTITPLNAAVFAGTDGVYTVTVGAALATQSLTFNNSGYTLSAASAQTITNTGNITVATGKTATIGANVTISRAGGFSISGATGGGGTLILEGGTVICTAASASEISSNSTVELRAGGTLTTTNSGAASLVIGELGTADANGNNGTLLVNGGTMNLVGTGNFVLGNLTVTGASTVSTVSISSGAINVSATSGNGIRFGSTAQSAGSITGVFNLDGGTVTAPAITRITPTGTGVINATFNFNGGTLVANKTNATFLQNLTAANVKAGGAKINTNGFDITIAQPLLDGTGGGGFDKLGAGTLTFTGTNTYTGTTTISAGTLVVGTGGTTGTLGSGPIVNNGVLTINRSDSVNLSSGMSGTGILNLNVAGTTTIGGTNSFSGPVNINVGRANITGTLASNIAVASGANIGGEGATTGSLTFGGTHALFFDPTSPAALTAASINASAATITLSPTAQAAGTGIVVLSAAGGIAGTPGTNFLFTGRGTAYMNGTNTELLFDYSPGLLKWRGNDAVNPTFWDVGTTTNWLNGATADKYLEGDTITFDDTASSFVVAVQGTAVGPANVTFNATTNYMLTGGAINSTSALTKLGTGTLVISNANTFAGGATISSGVVQLGDGVNASGSLSGAVTNNAAIVTNFGANNATVGGSISGSGSLTQDGSGTVSLTGSNSYGTTLINAGTLQVGDGGTTGTLGSGVVVNNATLAFNRSDTALVVSNSISGTGAVTKFGAGTVRVSGNNAYDGNTTIAAGTLTIDSPNALGSTLSGTTVVSGAALQLQGGVVFANEALTLNGQGISSLGALRNVSGSNTWTGDITAIPVLGIFRIASDAGLLTISGNIVTTGIATDQSVFQGSGDVLVTGVISGASRVGSSSNGAGVRTLAGANTYTGQTLVNGGTLVAASLNRVVGGSPSSNLGAPVDAVNGTIALGSGGASGIFRYVGAGETTDRIISLAGSTFGGTIDNQGTGPLVFSSATTAAAGVKSFTLTGTGVGEFSSGIGNGSGTVSVIKSGSGTWTLGGTSTYTGATTLSGGTLVVSGSLSGSTTTTMSAGTLTGGGSTGPVVANGGIVAPGSGLGVLTANGAVTMNAGSTLALQIDTTTPATGYDQFSVNGAVTLSGAALGVSGSYFTMPAITTDIFFVLLNDGADAITGTFAGIPEGGHYLAPNGQDFQVTYTAEFGLTSAATFGTAEGNDVALLAVPEPGAFVSLFSGLGILLAARRRRQ